MNLPQDNDDIRFDRLADGELSPEEYRQVLAALDDEPGGWKRCALAFLEAQALRHELAALRDEQVERPQSRPSSAWQAARESPAAQPVAGRSPYRYPLMALAMAASFLVAFGLGLAARSNWNAGRAPVTAETNMLAADDAPAGAQGPAPQAPRDRQPADDQPGPLGNVQLVLGGDGQGAPEQQVDLPVYHIRRGGADYLNGNISAMPPDVQQMLEQSGHRLLRQRTLVPLELEGGQQMVVPVEEIEIVPLRRPPL